MEKNSCLYGSHLELQDGPQLYSLECANQIVDLKIKIKTEKWG